MINREEKGWEFGLVSINLISFIFLIRILAVYLVLFEVRGRKGGFM